MTPQQELKALEATYKKLKQVPYDPLGANSNTYAHQLLKLSGFTVADRYGVVTVGSQTTYVGGVSQVPIPLIKECTPENSYKSEKGFIRKGGKKVKNFITKVTTSRLFGFLKIVSEVKTFERKVGPTNTIGWNNPTYGGAQYDVWGKKK